MRIKALAEILGELAELSDLVSMEEANVVLDRDRAAQYGIEQIPAIVLLRVNDDTSVHAGSFLTFPTVLAGMIIVEYELQMQGLSSVLFDAIEFQDIPVIMGVMVALGLIGIGFRLVTDLTIAILDPRQRKGRA